MKLKTLLCVGVLLLCSCSGKNKNSSEDTSSQVIDTSVLKIVCPTGAPAVAFYNQAENPNFETNSTPSNIVAMMNESSNKDIVVIDIIDLDNKTVDVIIQRRTLLGIIIHINKNIVDVMKNPSFVVCTESKGIEESKSFAMTMDTKLTGVHKIIPKGIEFPRSSYLRIKISNSTSSSVPAIGEFRLSG